MNFISICALLFCYIFFCNAGCPFQDRSLNGRKEHSIATENASPLERANIYLKSMYIDSRDDLIHKTNNGPIIIATGSNLTLRFGEYRESIFTTAGNYTHRKLVSHTAFASFVILEPVVYNKPDDLEIPLDNFTSTHVANYLSLLQAVYQDLPTCCNFTGSVLEREQEIVSLGISFLESVISNGHISQNQLSQFTGAAISLINRNIIEAAIYQLNTIHTKVMEWKSLMNEEQWKAVKVIIIGGHMPRGMESRLQYFSRLFNTTMTSGQRIIYAENVQSEKEAIELLGTHLLDFAVGKAFWNDGEHMHSDILSQATKEYLPILFGDKE